ncbi:MAG: hypothetical protein ACQESG_05305 [Nanobdellota archaeon]
MLADIVIPMLAVEVAELGDKTQIASGPQHGMNPGVFKSHDSVNSCESDGCFLRKVGHRKGQQKTDVNHRSSGFLGNRTMEPAGSAIIH